MASWIWVLIPLAAIIGGMILEYQKHKMKMMSRTDHYAQELSDFKKLIENMRSRIENLEAIAAADPQEFKEQKKTDVGMDDISVEEENQKQVRNLANKRRNKL